MVLLRPKMPPNNSFLLSASFYGLQKTKSCEGQTVASSLAAA